MVKLYLENTLKAKVAKEFVEIKSGFYDQDKLLTRDNEGFVEETDLSYKEMVHWIITKKPEFTKKDKT